MYQEKAFSIFGKYAVPQMVGLLVNSVYLIVDGVFIGNRLGRDAMAAAAVSVPAIEFLIAMALFVSSGSGILVSNKFGRKEVKEANAVFNASVIFLLCVSVLVAVFGNVFLNRCATFLGATADIHDDATMYLWYIVSFSPFLLFSFFLSSMVRNDNKPRLAMIALVVGSMSNIVLDYVFMYPLDMGISGAALATALGPIFSVIILLLHFLRKKGYLFFSTFTMPKGCIRQMATLGFPAFIMEFSIGIVTLAYNSAIVSYGFGEIGLASYLLVGYMLLIIATLFLGMGQGLQPVFSYYHGASDKARSDQLLVFAKITVISAGIASSVLVVLFSQKFFWIFSPDDPELVAFTSGKATWYFWGMLFAGYNILMISYWQSVKRTNTALLLSLLRSVIVLPVLLVGLPAVFGEESIWPCHSLAEGISVCIILLHCLRLRIFRPAAQYGDDETSRCVRQGEAVRIGRQSRVEKKNLRTKPESRTSTRHREAAR